MDKWRRISKPANEKRKIRTAVNRRRTIRIGNMMKRSGVVTAWFLGRKNKKRNAKKDVCAWYNGQLSGVEEVSNE